MASKHKEQKKEQKRERLDPNPERFIRGIDFLQSLSVSCPVLCDDINQMTIELNPAPGIFLDTDRVSHSEIPGRLSKETAERAFHDLVDFVCGIDYDAMHDAMHSVEDGYDCVMNTLKDLRKEYDRATSSFRLLVSDIEISFGLQDAFCELMVAVFHMAKEEQPVDVKTLRDLGDKLIASLHRVFSDVYRGEPVPPRETKVTDDPMTLPPPDPTELEAHLPSQREAMHLNEQWHIEDIDSSLATTDFARLDKSSRPLFANECIARLWGYSYRVWRDGTMTPRQKAQIPRFAPYPFYYRFFDFVSTIISAADGYRNKKLPVRGSVAIKNPIMGFPLAHRMKDMLMFAPREYFAPGRAHYFYMLLVKSVYIAAMTYLRRSVPHDARLHISPFLDKAEVAFVDFLTMLEQPVSGTVREYAAKCDKMRYAFLDALRGAASILECIEDDISVDEGYVPADYNDPKDKYDSNVDWMQGEFKKLQKEIRANRAIGNDVLFTVSGGEKGVEQPLKSRAGQFKHDMALEGLELIKKAKFNTLTSTEAARQVINDRRYAKCKDGYKNNPADIDALRKQIDRLADAEGLRT